MAGLKKENFLWGMVGGIVDAIHILEHSSLNQLLSWGVAVSVTRLERISIVTA